MLIGILSDTHGDIGRGVRAMDLLLARGAQAVIHCGDIGSEEMLDELAALCEAHAVPLHAVLGNVDDYEPGLRDYRDGTRVTMWGAKADVELGGRRICVMHGHDARGLLAAIASGTYDYVFTGHTHQTYDEREGRTRVINPGAVYRANPPSVALLELSTDTLEFIPTR